MVEVLLLLIGSKAAGYDLLSMQGMHRLMTLARSWNGNHNTLERSASHKAADPSPVFLLV
jgi:hypothetical protein